MAWGTFKVEDQRLKLIEAYLLGESSMADLCKLFNVSRKTAYKWYQRYLEYGEEGLKNLSRARHNNQIYSDEQIQEALEMKLHFSKWGPKKILAKLEQKYPEEEWPSRTRLHEIFEEHNLVTRRRFRTKVPATAPLGDLTDVNDTWAVDLKGWFLTGDGKKCEPLTITDCYSRYLIRCTQLKRHTWEYVWPVFKGAFLEYGLPKRIRSDNGSPFGSIGVGRLTKLSINFIKAGVIPEWINPGHPEENGRHERFHSTLKLEACNPPQKNMKKQIEMIKEFEHIYNFERPHEALNMKPPGSCYQASPRSWDGILRPPEYDRQQIDVRKICPSGSIWIRGNEYYISQSMTGEYVGLKTNGQDEIEIYYGPIYLAKIDKNFQFIRPELRKRRR